MSVTERPYEKRQKLKYVQRGQPKRILLIITLDTVDFELLIC